MGREYEGWDMRGGFFYEERSKGWPNRFLALITAIIAEKTKFACHFGKRASSFCHLMGSVSEILYLLSADACEKYR
jgi:hypothetical protein